MSDTIKCLRESFGLRRVAVLLVLVSSIGGSSVWAAVPDRLQTPARQSQLALASLLLYVTGFGSLLVAVGERGHILTSNDNANSWQQALVPVRVTLTAVQFVSPLLGWAVGHDGVVLHSSDGGRSWSKQLDGYQINQLLVDYYQQQIEQRLALETTESESENASEDDNDVDLDVALEDALFSLNDGPNRPLLDLYFIDQNRGWVLGAYGVLLQTNDGGKSWQPAILKLDNPDNFHLNAITEQAGRLLIVGEAGVLFRSDDLGQSWQHLDAAYEGPFFSAVALSQPGGFLLSGLRGRLFLTLDGGDSWREIETNTRSTFNAGLILSSGTLVGVGNGGALFVTEQNLSSENSLLDLPIQVQQGRQSYTSVTESNSGQLLLTGQKGITILDLEKLIQTQNKKQSQGGEL